MREDSPFTLKSSLVDVDADEIDKLLGPGTCEKYLGTRKAPPPLRGPDGKPTVAGVLNLASTSVNTLMSGLSAKAQQAQQRPQQQQQGAQQNDLWGGSLDGIGKKFSLFGTNALTSIKKGVNTVSSAAAGVSAASAADMNDECDSEAHGRDTWKSVGEEQVKRSAMTFVIDDDDEDGAGDDEGDGTLLSAEREEGRGRIEIPDTTTINVTRTEAEKAQALAIHRLSGMQKGDTIVIAKENLPGAILFPSMKEKEVRDENGEVLIAIGPDGTTPQPVTSSVHRYLVITKERFIVLDSGGQGVGSTAEVKSNHHLTELVKITFKKRNPELVTLFISDPGGRYGDMKKHMYRVAKRQEFVATLQVTCSSLFDFCSNGSCVRD